MSRVDFRRTTTDVLPDEFSARAALITARHYVNAAYMSNTGYIADRQYLPHVVSSGTRRANFYD